MKRILLWTLVLGAAPGLMGSACASTAAQVPQPPIAAAGDYHCEITRVAAISVEGESYDFEDAPKSFTFSAYNSPVTAEELMHQPRALDRYATADLDRFEPEPVEPVSASIKPDIFGARAHSLRSQDRRNYRQFGIAVSFNSDLGFFAYGPSPAGGAVAYKGSCRAP
ncbi:hypothetical protein [Hyphococcus sp.]|jgi:hypothetical protein|uniref:hypothetical protein n=1 Tax=Hyphococcus sp. TaxID=2038636 RepID=UPI003D0EB7D3